MGQPDSEDSWIEALKAGDEGAAQQLFQDYFQRLIRLARQKLGSLPERVTAPEDVVQSALNSFFQGMRREAFPQLQDRENLWRILVVITGRKAAHTLRDNSRQKRGGGRVLGESALHALGVSDFAGMAHVVDAGCDPEMAAMLQEEVTLRLQQLQDDQLREIAVLKMQGYTNAEIAGRFDCVPRTIERKLGLIRTTWEKLP